MIRRLKISKTYVVLCLFTALLLIQGCATTSFKSRPDLALRKDTKRIILMPMDIQLNTLTTGGVLKPEAEWTANATKCVERCLKEKMDAMDMQLLCSVDAVQVKMCEEDKDKEIQLLKLHEAIGHSILIHQYMPAFKLPGKNTFDWSLGPETVFLKKRFGADYALFVYLRDSYASAGRVAYFIVAAAVGVGIPLGQQVGFASLVYLETGDVVWFNRLARKVGDLRTPKAASDSVEHLLCDFPK